MASANGADQNGSLRCRVRQDRKQDSKTSATRRADTVAQRYATRGPASPATHIHMASFCPMAQTRRGRGTRPGAVGLFVEVDPEAKTTLKNISEASSAPQWAVVELLLLEAKEEIDRVGLHAWWSAKVNSREDLTLPQEQLLPGIQEAIDTAA